jgi:plasmid stabilization system protein ParE
MARLRWGRGALRDLDESCEYIATHSKRRAREFARKARTLAGDILEHPQQGSMVEDYGDPSIRERLLGSYGFIYRIEGEFVTLLLIRHGARLLPPEPPAAN